MLPQISSADTPPLFPVPFTFSRVAQVLVIISIDLSLVFETVSVMDKFRASRVCTRTSGLSGQYNQPFEKITPDARLSGVKSIYKQGGKQFAPDVSVICVPSQL